MNFHNDSILPLSEHPVLSYNSYSFSDDDFKSEGTLYQDFETFRKKHLQGEAPFVN